MNFYKTVSVLFLLALVGCVVNGEEEVKVDAPPAKTTVNYQCYTCNQNEDPLCADPYDGQEKHKTDCQGEVPFCRKIIQTVEGEKTIVRQCAKELYKPRYQGCYKTAGKSSQNVCTCESKDGKPCNTGFTYKSSILAIALFAIIAALLQ